MFLQDTSHRTYEEVYRIYITIPKVLYLQPFNFLPVQPCTLLNIIR